jgi:hypothetical protein
MTPAIPPDAKRVVLAAVVPCAQRFTECRDRAYRCEQCNGDGTRTVVTDIEVEPDDAVSGDTTVRVWLEVQL